MAGTRESVSATMVGNLAGACEHFFVRLGEGEAGQPARQVNVIHISYENNLPGDWRKLGAYTGAVLHVSGP